MNEYYMKMKDLVLKLNKDGFNITGRMIKHYVDIGILQKPYYKCSNQALYADFHYVRLKRILTEKKNGKSVSKIKNEILKENEDFLQKTGLDDIESEEAINIAKKMGSLEKEIADTIKKDINNEVTYTKEELLEKTKIDGTFLESDDSFFDLAVDTGIIEEKEKYTDYDLYIIRCIKNLITVKNRNRDGSGELIKRIGEVSKICKIATDLSYLINSDEDNSWLYTDLFEAVLLSKTGENNEKKVNYSVQEENKLKYQQALEELRQMDFDFKY